MPIDDRDTAVILDSADPVEANLAAQLLGEAGIPTLRHGPDFDVAELGSAAHDSARGVTLLVPRSALERAREVLREAWGALPEDPVP